MSHYAAPTQPLTQPTRISPPLAAAAAVTPYPSPSGPAAAVESLALHPRGRPAARKGGGVGGTRRGGRAAGTGLSAPAPTPTTPPPRLPPPSSTPVMAAAAGGRREGEPSGRPLRNPALSASNGIRMTRRIGCTLPDVMTGAVGPSPLPAPPAVSHGATRRAAVRVSPRGVRECEKVVVAAPLP